MKTFIYWASLPTKIQMKILKRTEFFDLMRCRWTCEGMKRIVFNKEFQAKYCNRHGPAPSKFLFDVYLPGKSHININIAPAMEVRSRPVAASGTPPPDDGAPAMEDALPEPQVMALPVFGGPAPVRLAPAGATSSGCGIRKCASRKRKSESKPEDVKQNHLMQFWKPPNYHTHRDMYNCFYQSIFRSKDPIEVINLSDSDAE